MVVMFELGCERGCEYGVEGVRWQIAVGDAVDDDGKAFDVVWVMVKWLPMFIAAGVWSWLFSW